MRCKRFLSFFSLTIILAIFFSCLFLPFNNLSAYATGDYTSAKAMCVMEGTSKRVLSSHNENSRLAMASTTKIMTAITAIENCSDLDEQFEVSPKSIGISGTSIYLRKGEVMSTRDLLYGLMLVSGNDASVAIGEHVGGNTKNFVELMNKTAKKIGANNSHFDNTHGLDSATHYTTAYDLALITSYALENETFREIVSTKNTKIVNKDGKTRYLRNKNKLLSTLDGCTGVKTGFTNDAGRCLVSSCERDGMRVVCVVLNCGPMFEESSALIENAYKQYKMVDLSSLYNFDDSIIVTGGRKESAKIGTKEKFSYPLKDRELEKIDIVYNIEKEIEAPVDEGQEIGEIKIFLDNNLLFSEKVYTMERVRRDSIWSRLKDLVDKW